MSYEMDTNCEIENLENQRTRWEGGQLWGKNSRDIMIQQLLKKGLFGCLVAIHEGDQMSGSFVSSKYNSYVYM